MRRQGLALSQSRKALPRRRVLRNHILPPQCDQVSGWNRTGAVAIGQSLAKLKPERGVLKLEE